MTHLDGVLDRIRDNGWHVELGEPARPKAIAAVQQAIGQRLPPSYRTFLERYGSLEVDDRIFAGVAPPGATVVALTEDLREWQEVPPTIVVISPHEDGGYALDLSQRDAAGECPVVTYEGGPDRVDRVAIGFDDFLMEELQWFLEQKNDAPDDDDDDDDDDDADDDDDDDEEEEDDEDEDDGDDEDEEPVPPTAAKRVVPSMRFPDGGAFSAEIAIDGVPPERVLAWIRPFFERVFRVEDDASHGVSYAGRAGGLDYEFYLAGDASATVYGQERALPRWPTPAALVAAARAAFHTDVTLLSAEPLP